MNCFAFVFFAAFAAQSCAGDRLENTYLPPKSAQTAGGNSAFLAAPLRASGSSAFGQASNLGQTYLPPNRGHASAGSFAAPSKLRQSQSFDQSGYNLGGPQSYSQPKYKSGEQDVPILKFSNENDGNGNYAYSYETGNGIKAEEVGKSVGDSQAVQGNYAYTGPDGVQYSVSYVADENGFHASGDHLPTPPPIPEAILRSIEQNQRDEANGIVDDGAYRGDFGQSANLKTSYDNNKSGYRY